MYGTHNWQCWAVTGRISDHLIEDYIAELERKNLGPSLQKYKKAQFKIWQIDFNLEKNGNIVIYTGCVVSERQFGGCVLSENEEDGRSCRNWIAEHSELFVEKVTFRNPLMLVIADCMLSKGPKGVHLSYAPETDQGRLKKLEFDFSDNDVQELSRAGAAENVFSGSILPYLYEHTGVRGEKLPISELKIHDRVLVTRSQLRTFQGSSDTTCAIISGLLEFLNAQYSSA
ncbi:LANO_0G10022g1_1 [Lachancea nothofagi CBS 11611]|uniref:LANO_0G10022g1_1 n=1 Tax=Lachancea nothofagi CBS 11611 TaxID=1266666 RepID=A0A1G4KIU8_9SACH|nr:LANO_0G10022g1_1 [Lachancea nothofagi CBS 11611]